MHRAPSDADHIRQTPSPQTIGFVAHDCDDLKNRTKQLALRVMRLYRTLPDRDDGRILGKQLLRSGTSIGANYRGARRARSKAEFIAKLGIVLEESDETAFWLELLRDSGLVTPEKVSPLIDEVNQLTSIFVSSICTAKGVQK